MEFLLIRSNSALTNEASNSRDETGHKRIQVSSARFQVKSELDVSESDLLSIVVGNVSILIVSNRGFQL